MLTSEFPPYVWGGVGRYSSEVVFELRNRAVVDVVNVPTYVTRYAQVDRGFAIADSERGRTLHVVPTPPVGGATSDRSEGDAPGEARRITGDLADWLNPPYDVLFAQDFFVAPLASDLLLGDMVRKVVASCHLPLYAGFSYFDRPHAADRQHEQEALLFRMASRVVVPSRFTREVVLQSYGIPPHRVVVLPEGVRTSGRNAVRAWRRDRPIRMLSVGRLTQQKGVHYMVDLANVLDARGLDFAYTIVGRGPMEPFLRGRIERARSRRRIRFVASTVPADQMFDLYRAHDLCVSLSVYETFGLVLLEAMACGCVPVAFAVGAVEEVVGPGEAALVPIGDLDAMAEAIVRLSKDPDRRAAMAERGRTTARCRSWSRHVAGLLRVFELHG